MKLREENEYEKVSSDGFQSIPSTLFAEFEGMDFAEEGSESILSSREGTFDLNFLKGKPAYARRITKCSLIFSRSLFCLIQ